MSKTPIPFKTFWDAYGVKRDRYAAEPVWNRLSGKDREAAIAGIEAYREDCRRRGVAMCYGVRYLRHRRWEDEYGEEPAAGQDTPVQPDLFGAPADAFDDMETW